MRKDHNNTNWYRKDRNNRFRNRDYENDEDAMRNNNRRNNRPCNNNYSPQAGHRLCNYLPILHKAVDCRLTQNYYCPKEYQWNHFPNSVDIFHNQLNRRCFSHYSFDLME